MDFLSDPILLARVQFALTAAYHFFFVPMTVGLGLILVINETRYFRHRNDENAAATSFWAKIFAVTFAIGVATGITMEFSFGTNWADYARFVGDIFGAPLAAEALFAFFLESVFLGIVLFGRKRVSAGFYLVSTWLVWLGSCLSALWILIANSWMQTPAGAELSADGSKAVITDFFEAAFNSSLAARYSHVIMALIIMGAFVTMAVAAWYMHKGTHEDFASRTLKIGAVVGIIATCCMLVTAHSSSVEVSEEQPTKLAMMEGMYDSEVPGLALFGWVDEDSQELVAPLSIPGATSFLATGTWDTEYAGLNDLAQTEQYGDLDVDNAPVNFVFQTYHLMIIMFGLIALTIILVLIFLRHGRIKKMKWLQWVTIISPIFPFIAIQSGWFTAELGRQPWVVYPAENSPDGVSLLVNNGASQSVSNAELMITMLLFILVYLFLLIAWARIVCRFIKQGPSPKPAEADADAIPGVTTSASDSAAAAGDAASGSLTDQSSDIATDAAETGGAVDATESAAPKGGE